MPTASAPTVPADPGDPTRRDRMRRMLPVLGLCCWLLFGALLLYLREAAVQSATQDMERQVAARLDALAAAIPQQIPPGKAGKGEALAVHAAMLMPLAQTSGFSLRAAVLEPDGSAWLVPERLAGSSPLNDELMLSLLGQPLHDDPEKAQSCGTPDQGAQPLHDASLSICRRTLELMNADLVAMGLFPRPYLFSEQADRRQLLLLLGWGLMGLAFAALALALRRDRSRVRDLEERFGLALREEQDRSRELAVIHGLMREGAVIIQDGRVTHCNPSFAYGIGLEPDMAPGLDCAAFISPEDLPDFENTLQRLREDQEPLPHFSLRLVTELGDLRWAACTLARVIWQGEEAALLCFLDMTPLKKAEQAQTLAEAELRAIMDADAFGVAVFDAFGALATANAAWNAMWDDPAAGGTRRVTITEQSPALPETVMRALRDALDGRPSTLENLEYLPPQSEARWFTLRCLPLRDTNDRSLGALMLQKDATQSVRQSESEQKLTAQAAQARYDLLRLHDHMTALMDATPSVLIGVDQDRRVTFWNSMAAERFDLPPQKAVGRILGTLDHTLARHEPLIHKALRERRYLRVSMVPYTRDGATFYEDLSVHPVETTLESGALIRIDDVTRRMQLEEGLARTDKLSSVGMLAAGVVHEFKNPLRSILQSAQNLERRLLEELPVNQDAAEESGTSFSALREYARAREIPALLESIRNAGQFIDGMVSSMLRFGRKHDLARLPADANALVEKALEFASSDQELLRLGFPRVTVRRELAPDLPPVLAAESDIVRALLQLLRTAVHELHKGPCDGEAAVSIGTRRDGNFAVITLRDNGPGMPPEACRRIFEPFYTTHDPGRGGFSIGLSLAFFIVATVHKGSLQCESALGKGTLFTMRLPLAQQGT